MNHLEFLKLSLKICALLLMGEHDEHQNIMTLDLINSDSFAIAAVRKITVPVRMGYVMLWPQTPPLLRDFKQQRCVSLPHGRCALWGLSWGLCSSLSSLISQAAEPPPLDHHWHSGRSHTGCAKLLPRNDTSHSHFIGQS